MLGDVIFNGLQALRYGIDEVIVLRAFGGWFA